MHCPHLPRKRAFAEAPDAVHPALGFEDIAVEERRKSGICLDVKAPTHVQSRMWLLEERIG